MNSIIKIESTFGHFIMFELPDLSDRYVLWSMKLVIYWRFSLLFCFCWSIFQVFEKFRQIINGVFWFEIVGSDSIPRFPSPSYHNVVKWFLNSNFENIVSWEWDCNFKIDLFALWMLSADQRLWWSFWKALLKLQ